MTKGRKRSGPPPRGHGPRGGARGGARGNSRKEQGFSQQVATKVRGAGLGFTLADEARRTSSHDETFWAQSNKLRYRPVTFVTAGPIEPMAQLNILLQKNNHTDGMADAADDSTSPRLGFPEIAGSQPEPHAPNAHVYEESDPDENAVKDLFFFDIGDKPKKKTPTKGPHIPQRPSTSRSSSEEEVILFKGRSTVAKPRRPTDEINMTQLHAEIQAVEQNMQPRGWNANNNAEKQCAGPEMARQPNKLRCHDRQSGRRNRPRPYNRTREEIDEKDAIIADYIANLQQGGENQNFVSQQQHNQRDLGASEEDIVFEDEAETEELPAATPNAESDGTEYKEMDDSLQRPDGKIMRGLCPRNSYDEGSELDNEVLTGLIAEELEAYSHQNLAFSEADPESDSSIDANMQARETAGGFDSDDLMDWGRPSLQTRQKKSKATGGILNFGLSDREEEVQFEAAWKNDRKKKALRKKQREELRASGALGKNAKHRSEDPLTRYVTGMNIDQLAEELRNFLVVPSSSLTLPPMDKHARKVIHELANKFNVKSKSVGKGEHRKPTLYRTSRTLPFVKSTFDRAISKINRPYFPRMDVRDKHAPRLSAGKSSYAEASYRDGEIVGAAAPELGVDNRGRSMLEKMGWSQGTALGATHNKGILQPVPHAMKRSKAGLG